jgi:glycosyltransferase involved in cell wall biosynthesis
MTETLDVLRDANRSGTLREGYVCAFRGRRDAYQAPLALQEGGLLDQFITDAYAFASVRSLARLAPTGFQEKLALRKQAGIPSEKVRCLWSTTLLEQARHRLGFAPALTYLKLDCQFSYVAARRAEIHRANLFLYSPYAWEAFVATYSHTPRRVLFQYHPHSDLERRILEDDCVKFPDIRESFSSTQDSAGAAHLVARERDCWKHADEILCASRFTKLSLLEAGADEKQCHVVSYGIEVPPESNHQLTPPDFRCVFVGSGGRRKGLHHLLLAWQAAKLPPTSELTLVCRVIDREIERIASATPRVKLVRGLPQAELEPLYANSSLFVMPSLVEGFGQVYLEALAQGCPVLGTTHTCLPDLGQEEDGVFLVEPGNVDHLTSQLESLSRTLPGNADMRRAARSCAKRFTWPAFRKGIRAVLSHA